MELHRYPVSASALLLDKPLNQLGSEVSSNELSMFFKIIFVFGKRNGVIQKEVTNFLLGCLGSDV